jgi:hypothetical protein
LGSGLNAGNVGAEIDVIKPVLLAQTHAPIRYSLRFRISRTSFLYRLAHFTTSHFLPSSHRAVIRVCDDAGNVIETHEHNGDFKKP